MLKKWIQKQVDQSVDKGLRLIDSIACGKINEAEKNLNTSLNEFIKDYRDRFSELYDKQDEEMVRKRNEHKEERKHYLEHVERMEKHAQQVEQYLSILNDLVAKK